MGTPTKRSYPDTVSLELLTLYRYLEPEMGTPTKRSYPDTVSLELLTLYRYESYILNPVL